MGGSPAMRNAQVYEPSLSYIQPERTTRDYYCVRAVRNRPYSSREFKTDNVTNTKIGASPEYFDAKNFEIGDETRDFATVVAGGQINDDDGTSP